MLVHYYGHVGQRSGYGRAATDLCKALHRAGVTLQIRPLCDPSQVDLEMVGELAPLLTRVCSEIPDAAIIHTLPYDCRKVYDMAEFDIGVPGRMMKLREEGMANPSVPTFAYT